MISIRILFLGPSQDFTDVETVELELSKKSTIADVRQHLLDRYPNLEKAMPSIRFAVNESFAVDDTVLQDHDVIALIPPVSGGSNDRTTMIELLHDVICVDQVREFVMGDSALGGIATFEGATRSQDDPAHGKLIRLEYEVYKSMALKELQTLADEAVLRWSAGKVAMVHRLGNVPPGEVSVMISVACAHRKEAFEACRWLIDMLKKNVPIWKKDVYEDGYIHWVVSEKTSSTVE